MVVTVDHCDDTEKLRQSIIWCVHGTVLLRVTHQTMRPQLARRRFARGEMDDEHGIPLSPAEAFLAQLRKTRGPIRFSDLAEQERPGEDPKAFGSSVIEDVAMPASQEK